ncbi:MAG: pilus assembly protein, partial [Selenomonadaceae bacterium]|nr:pilus assembly protein [Selenomonadaceae bacterium]
MTFKHFKQRGQVLVLYALLIPLLFLFAGVGLDLGWYSLNVSRLQNAADAAALAGAK